MKLTSIRREIVRLDPRRSHRLNLMSCGEVVLRTGSHRCEIIEISQHGGLIQTSAKAKQGEDGLLRCDGLDLLFRVVRIQGDVMAVEFVDEETEPELEAQDYSRLENNKQILRFINL